MNLSKCHVLALDNRITYDYCKGDVTLSWLREIKDLLGVTFDDELRFSRHMETVVSEPMRFRGFVIKSCSEFTNI